MDDWKQVALEMRAVPYNITRIMKKTGQTEYEIRKLFKEDDLRKWKEKIDAADQKKQDAEGEEKQLPNKARKKFVALQNLIPVEYTREWKGNPIITFGLIGDTHINSKYTQLTYLHRFYDICAERGIKDVYHTGDVDDGERMRPGHQYECYTQGAGDHIREILRVYPKREGMTTHFITGNHDASIYKHVGLDIGESIALNRDDLHYLGRDAAKIEVAPNCVLELRHPWDGTAYATSYKPQKLIEGMESDSKPNILAIGHYHKCEYLFHRNVHCFQTLCFQSQTPFTRGKGIYVSMGGWIVTIEVDDKGYVQRIIPELIAFYKMIENDYLNWRE